MSGLTILSFVVLPVGLVLTVCALSGIRFMEELAYNFCRFKLSFGETCHVRLVAILLWICFFLFAHESWKLSTVSMSSPCMLAGGFVGAGKGSSGKMSFVLRALGSLFGFTGGGAREDEGPAFSTVGGNPGVGAPTYIPVNVGGSSTLGLECKAYRWRHERNWWIGSVNLIVWLTLWRLSAKLHSLAQENRTLRERVLKLTEGTKDNAQRLPVGKSSQSGSSSGSGARSQQPASVSTDKDTSGIELTTRRRTAERDDNHHHHTSSSGSGDTSSTRAAELKKGSKAQ